MTLKIGGTLACALFLVASTSRTAPQCRDERVDQNTYLALNSLVHVYAPDINKLGGGWTPFTVQVLVGQYQSPLLLPMGYLIEDDLKKILAQRHDIKAYPLRVAGYDPKQQPTPAPGATVTVTDGSNKSTMITLKSVVPAGWFGKDHILLYVCS